MRDDRGKKDGKTIKRGNAGDKYKVGIAYEMQEDQGKHR